MSGGVESGELSVCVLSLCVCIRVLWPFCVVYLPGIVSYQDGTGATGVTV